MGRKKSTSYVQALAEVYRDKDQVVENKILVTTPGESLPIKYIALRLESGSLLPDPVELREELRKDQLARNPPPARCQLSPTLPTRFKRTSIMSIAMSGVQDTMADSSPPPTSSDRESAEADELAREPAPPPSLSKKPAPIYRRSTRNVNAKPKVKSGIRDSSADAMKDAYPTITLGPLETDVNIRTGSESDESTEEKLKSSQLFKRNADDADDEASPPTKKVKTPKTRKATRNAEANRPLKRESTESTGVASSPSKKGKTKNAWGDIEGVSQPPKRKAKDETELEELTPPSTKREITNESPSKKPKLILNLPRDRPKELNTVGEPPRRISNKPKSRVVSTCVNCQYRSSIAWRNQDSKDRDNCEKCGKKRGKKM